MLFIPDHSRALPPPEAPDELQQQADLILVGRINNAAPVRKDGIETIADRDLGLTQSHFHATAALEGPARGITSKRWKPASPHHSRKSAPV